MTSASVVETAAVATTPAGTSRARRWLANLVRCLLGGLACALVGVAVWFFLWKVDQFGGSPLILLPRPVSSERGVQLHTPAYSVTAPLAAYEDELFAYLMFDYLRHNRVLGGVELLLTYDRRRTSHRYCLLLRGDEDLVQGFAELAAVRLAGVAGQRSWALTPNAHIADIRRETQLFISAYNLPVRRKLETLPHATLAKYLRHFIQFKSNTDPRVRMKLEPTPKPLSGEEAQRLAGDIITIAGFYSLPLEFLLGIGAMENNYMNVRGDLKHSVWKRKAAPDDVVLERRKGRVRILNDSAGVWQITRETLRYAHALYLRDERDYSLLPEHLRPPAELRMNDVSPLVLTTYAGILLRDLLDRFDGDVTLAVSAYNGGPARPNLRYGAGVHSAASHARRVLEQSAALKGETVVNMRWIRPR